jgi:hypothetical protein
MVLYIHNKLLMVFYFIHQDYKILYISTKVVLDI